MVKPVKILMMNDTQGQIQALGARLSGLDEDVHAADGHDALAAHDGIIIMDGNS